MCGANAVGVGVGGVSMYFEPGVLRAGDFSADTGTAGSTMLLAQVAVPCMLFAGAPCTAVLRGGTNADMAPQLDYTMLVR